MKTRWTLGWLQVLVVAATLVQCAPASAALSPRPKRTYVTNGTVNAIAVARDGATYLGGSFSAVGPSTGPAAAIDASSGHVKTDLPVISGRSPHVFAVAPDGAGGWYIGGHFSRVGGFPIRGLAHILANGSLDRSFLPFRAHVQAGTVDALLLSGQTLYVGGTFNRIAGRQRLDAAAFDVRTGKLTGWDPEPIGPVHALAISASTVYMGGQFDQVRGASRANIAAVDATSGQPTAWDPEAIGNVYALAVSGSTVYAGGEFDQIGGQARSNLAALDSGTGQATAWNPGATSPCSQQADSFYPIVSALAISGSNVYVAGYFTQLGGQSRSYLGAVDANSGAPTSWNPNPDRPVTALAVSGSTLYAGGDFTEIGGQSRSHLAALSLASGEATSWRADANGTDNFSAPVQPIDCQYGPAADVNALATDGSTVYAGGDFTSVGLTPRQNIAALDPHGNLTPWNPGADAQVQALVASAKTVYAGGGFGTIGGEPRSRLAALSASSGQATAWDPMVSGSFVDALKLSASTLYAGGNFDFVNGQRRANIAAINAHTSQVTSWNPGVGGPPPSQWGPKPYVAALALDRRTIYVGGYFSRAGGRGRDYLAALSRTTGKASSWNPYVDVAYSYPVVDALKVSGSRLYVGGRFRSIGGRAIHNLAALDIASAKATAWNPEADGLVSAVTVLDGVVYVGGDFQTIGRKNHRTGEGRQFRIALTGLDPRTAAVTRWNPQPLSGYSERYPHPFSGHAEVGALLVSGSSLLVGGSFTGFATGPQQGFAEFSTIH